jgi:hypothetical protein
MPEREINQEQFFDLSLACQLGRFFEAGKEARDSLAGLLSINLAQYLPAAHAPVALDQGTGVAEFAADDALAFGHGDKLAALRAL